MPNVHAAFTASLNALPAVNLTVFAAGIVMVSPVDGLRPARSARAPVENEPKPGHGNPPDRSESVVPCFTYSNSSPSVCQQSAVTAPPVDDGDGEAGW